MTKFFLTLAASILSLIPAMGVYQGLKLGIKQG